MSDAGVAEGALREVVSRSHRRDPNAHVFAVSATGYEGKPTLVLDDGARVQVHWCASVLEFRERLTAPQDELIVLVTPREEREIGEDAIAAVARQRLERVEVWEPVKALFKAGSLSPKVASERWLPDALLRHAPSRGYAPAPNGAVTFDHALAALSGAVLGVSHPAATELLVAVSKLSPNPSEQRVLVELGRYHGERLGPVGDVLLATTVAGHAAHAVPLGLAAQVVYSSTAGGLAESQREAAVRLERYTNGERVSVESGSAWGAASERLFAAGSESERRVWTVDGERLLEELGVADRIAASNVLPAALDARTKLAGAALERWLIEGAGEARASALESIGAVGSHLLSSQSTVRKLEMIARLIQFSETSEPPPASSLREAAESYLREGGPLDLARTALDGEVRSSALTELSTAVAVAVDPRRESRSERFATLLRAATAADSDEGLLPVERMQSELVGLLARSCPVLLLVLDGMSEADFRSLSPSLGAAGWSQVSPGGEERRPAMSVLPSLTKFSRASLMSGKLDAGGQGVEAAGFQSALREVGVARLFHKADVRAGEDLRQAIEDTKVRVVGVVVNAIDDLLDKGAQVSREWTVERIGPLEGLLAVAAESGRAVVLAADHGHVEERGSELRFGGGGARWRASGSGDVGEGELEFKGRRVLADGGSVILPTIEQLRYKQTAAGYHGGATPQEVLAPAAIFTPAGVRIPGFSEVVPTTPDWWELGHVEVLEPVVDRPATARPLREPEAQEQLFESQGTQASPCPHWVEKLMSSRQFESQRARAPRPLADERVGRTLAELDRRGGVATVEVISEALGVPSSRGRTIISSMQQLLNIDGYGILTLDSGTNEVRINRPILETQFEL